MMDKFLDGFLASLKVILYVIALVIAIALPLILGACVSLVWYTLYIIMLPVAVGLLNMVFN